MDFWLVAYILISAILGLSLVSFLYKSGQSIGGIALVVLLILIYVFYGLRWFKGGKLKGTTVNGKIEWPPILNMCPDFMSTYTDSNNKVYCYDAGNFYDMKTYNGAGQVEVTVNGVSGQRALLLKDASKTNSKQKYPMTDVNNLTTVLSDSRGKYVKWEGILDGTNINTQNLSKAPKP